MLCVHLPTTVKTGRPLMAVVVVEVIFRYVCGMSYEVVVRGKNFKNERTERGKIVQGEQAKMRGRESDMAWR